MVLPLRPVSPPSPSPRPPGVLLPAPFATRRSKPSIIGAVVRGLLLDRDCPIPHSASRGILIERWDRLSAPEAVAPHGASGLATVHGSHARLRGG